MKEDEIRNEEVILEEIQDLTQYLDAIPSSIKNGNAFNSYEARLTLLSEELFLSKLRRTYQSNFSSEQEGALESLILGLSNVPMLQNVRNQIFFLKNSSDRQIEKSLKKDKILDSSIFTSFLSAAFSSAFALFPLALPFSVIGSLLTGIKLFSSSSKKQIELQKKSDALYSMSIEIDSLISRVEAEKLTSESLKMVILRLILLLKISRPELYPEQNDIKLKQLQEYLRRVSS